MLAVREIDSSVHARANDTFAELFVIAVVKAVAGKLSFDFVADRDEESRNIVPKEVDELIVGNNDQHIGFRLLEIRAQHCKSSLGVLAKLFLLFESRATRGALRRHAVMKIHEIFPLASGLEKNIRCVARRQRGN